MSEICCEEKGLLDESLPALVIVAELKSSSKSAKQFRA